MLSKLLAFRLFVVLCLTLIFSSGLCQQRTVVGTVKSPDNAPLTGVTISVRGTTISTQTDADGNFALKVPNGSNTLILTSVGYESQEISIANQTNVTVSLKSTTSTLNEVVVTGYGTQRKKDITGAVSVI